MGTADHRLPPQLLSRPATVCPTAAALRFWIAVTHVIRVGKRCSRHGREGCGVCMNYRLQRQHDCLSTDHKTTCFEQLAYARSDEIVEIPLTLWTLRRGFRVTDFE